jgi:hypothetical protein
MLPLGSQSSADKLKLRVLPVFPSSFFREMHIMYGMQTIALTRQDRE